MNEKATIESSSPVETAVSDESSAQTPALEPDVSVENPDVLGERIIDALRTVFDPEIPVNIYELGLIYDVAVDPQADVGIKMTLTSPHCPVAETLPGEVQATAAAVPGVGRVEVEVVWDPAWNPGMMSEAARLELGMF